MRFLLLLIIATACAVLSFGCETEDARAMCESGGACEQNMLNNCNCCSAVQTDIEKCQQQTRDNCASGRFAVNLSAEDCARNNQTYTSYVDAGDSPCSYMDAGQLQQFCAQVFVED